MMQQQIDFDDDHRIQQDCVNLKVDNSTRAPANFDNTAQSTTGASFTMTGVIPSSNFDANKELEVNHQKKHMHTEVDGDDFNQDLNAVSSIENP